MRRIGAEVGQFVRVVLEVEEHRRIEAGEFATIQELAEAVSLAERHVSRQLRLAYLAPEVLKRLTCGREASTISLYDLCFLAGETWQQQAVRAFR